MLACLILPSCRVPGFAETALLKGRQGHGPPSGSSTPFAAHVELHQNSINGLVRAVSKQQAVCYSDTGDHYCGSHQLQERGMLTQDQRG